MRGVPAVSSEVVVGDAGPAGGLLVRDVGRHQHAALETHMPDRMPVVYTDRYLNICILYTYIYV